MGKLEMDSAYFCKISSTFFPVSNIDEIRLLAKTSGDISVKMCSVAKSLRAVTIDSYYWHAIDTFSGQAYSA